MSLGASSSRLSGRALWLMLHARRYHLIQSISAITLLQLQILWDPLVSALLRQSVQLPRTSGFRDCCCFYRQSLLIYCDLRCNYIIDTDTFYCCALFSRPLPLHCDGSSTNFCNIHLPTPPCATRTPPCHASGSRSHELHGASAGPRGLRV